MGGVNGVGGNGSGWSVGNLLSKGAQVFTQEVQQLKQEVRDGFDATQQAARDGAQFIEQQSEKSPAVLLNDGINAVKQWVDDGNVAAQQYLQTEQGGVLGQVADAGTRALSFSTEALHQTVTLAQAPLVTATALQLGSGSDPIGTVLAVADAEHQAGRVIQGDTQAVTGAITGAVTCLQGLA